MRNKILERFKEYINATQFNAVRLGLASPEKILSLSYGQIKRIETINYRTLKPERDGLFCARTFGPVKDWECNCGKYKRMKHRGVTCEKCGVEVIQARVRRERMGHIELVSPVCHIWYLKGIPSYLSIIFDLPVKELERIIYFNAYMVLHRGKSPYPIKTLLSAVEYENYVYTHPEDLDFKAEMGAEAVYEYLKFIDLELQVQILKDEYEKTASVAQRHKLMRRIKVFSSLLQANLKPEWMVMKVLPVLPPDLRPLVPLEGGRFASSDLNELYRRVLNRNIRLSRLMEIKAPSVIIKNEKRMLQESVDALIDNGRRGQPVRGTNRRSLKSLSEMLRGKQGRFRQNLLGRRVDYSGRSVIVVDPELRMDQCGLPKAMALELFKSYVLAGLIERELAPNLRVAKRMIEDLDPEVWDVLEEVVKGRPVLLNRAPTLHRLGIQAFYPILVDGKAIKVHPLVCSSFNADFDGDQMAVHLPLSKRAQQESARLILSTQNILSPANGRPVTTPSQDMVLGMYYMTKARCAEQGEGTVFASTDEVVTAYQCKSISLHARIKVRMNNKIVDTTVGRVQLYQALPKGTEFHWLNKVVKGVDLAKVIEKIYYRFGREATVLCLDKIKKLGFSYATHGGISLSLENLLIPKRKDGVLAKAEKEVHKVEKMYLNGVITNGERHNKIIDIWGRATADVADVMTQDLENQDQEAYENADKKGRPFNPLFMMLNSGARGSKDQIKQLVGMRGPMAKPSGEIMETPVKSNFKQGLSVFEYFISSHGARKGQADTALKTANSGYLTRRLVDVAQDLVTTIVDCGTPGFIKMRPLQASGDVLMALTARVFGRVLAQDLKDPVTGELLFEKGHIFGRDDLSILADSAVLEIPVRSTVTCWARRGVCCQCYGFDLSKSALVDIGTTVGIIAAQSIGEPGTQLTMRTFHIGGTASGMVERPYYEAKHDGKISLRGVRSVTNRDDKEVILSRKARLFVIGNDGRELQSHHLEYGSSLLVHDGQVVSEGTKLAEWDPHNRVIITEKSGPVEFVDLMENVTVQQQFSEETSKQSLMVLDHRSDKYQPALTILAQDGREVQYYLPAGAHINVVEGDRVEVGDVLVRMPREMSKTQDITGGLPRIAELFEARAPKDPAIVSDINGEVVFGGLHRGMRKIAVVSGSESYDYFVPRGKQLNVGNGEHVSAGDQLTAGAPVLHDVLRIQGPDVVQEYLIDHIQQIYCLQGVKIDNRHVELIVRQMTRRVRIVESGNTEFLIGDRVDKVHLQSVNAALRAEGKQPAIAKPILMGITQASLDTESWISAASFQETTRILTDAALSGSVDSLDGLKENVIVGRLIPAGTGVESFKRKYLHEDEQGLEYRARQLQQTAHERELANNE